MSKRTRGSRTARTRSAPRPASALQRPTRLVDAEVAAPGAPAVDLETADERDPVTPRPERTPTRAATRASSNRPTGRSGGLLAAKAAEEYVYVARDLTRITRFATGIVAVMLVLWLLIDVTKVISY
jgi:hypothetical protein